MKFRFSKLIWCGFLLVAAAFVIVNQLNGFDKIGVLGVIAAFFSAALAILCLANLRFVPLPTPLAVLYIVLRAPLGWPDIQWWALILAALLASTGLAVLLPKKHW